MEFISRNISRVGNIFEKWDAKMCFETHYLINHRAAGYAQNNFLQESSGFVDSHTCKVINKSIRSLSVNVCECVCTTHCVCSSAVPLCMTLRECMCSSALQSWTKYFHTVLSGMSLLCFLKCCKVNVNTHTDKTNLSIPEKTDQIKHFNRN